jgi:hypothetical protein
LWSTNCLPGSKALAINGIFADKFDGINTGAIFTVWKRWNALIPTLVAWQDVIQIKLLPGLEIRGRVIERRRPRSAAVFQRCRGNRAGRGGGARGRGKLFCATAKDAHAFPWFADLNTKLQNYAEQSFIDALDFSYELSQAKDIQDFARIYVHFVQKMFKSVGQQAKDFAEACTDSTARAIKSAYNFPSQRWRS